MKKIKIHFERVGNEYCWQCDQYAVSGFLEDRKKNPNTTTEMAKKQAIAFWKKFAPDSKLEFEGE